MGENCLDEIIEHLGFRRHPPARIGMHVPGAQLVQCRGFFVREVQDVTVVALRARGAVQDLRVNVRSMNSLAKPRVGGKSSAGAPFSQGTRMPRTEFIATGFHVPERVVTNDDLSAIMDTSDEWITPRSGIKTRHWVSEGETGVTLARRASLQALAKAGMKASELDCIVYCTCTPDHFEPGNGVFLQRELGISDIPAIDVRNQCSGFVYGLSVADAWIRVGQYTRVLLVGAEVHSRGLDRTTRGRDTAVLFGRARGSAILGPTDAPGRGVLSTHLYADGRHAEKLWVDAPGLAHDPFISAELIEQGKHRAVMEGREVFKFASVLMPQSVATALKANGVTPADVKLLVPHQANLRILEMVQKAVGLRDDQVYVNIQKYGNTTAASIPIALHEALCAGRLARGDLLIMTAFGSGFTWASAAIRW